MNTRWLIVGVCLFSSFALLHAQEAAGPTPAQALQRLKEGNERFATDKLESKDLGTKKRKDLAKGQHPFAVVLTCADSRVPPELIFNQGLGDLFVVRVAGNISDPYIVGSIEYAVEHFGVPLILVLGHDSCGAVKAAMGKDKPGGDLGKLLAEIHVGEKLPADQAGALSAGIKNNVRYQTSLFSKRSEVIKSYVDQKKVQVVSGVYSLETGKVEWLLDK